MSQTTNDSVIALRGDFHAVSSTPRGRMSGWWPVAREALWSVAALPLVLVFTASILVLPRPKTKLPITGR